MRHMYERCSGHSPSLHRVLVPTLCDEGAVAHDICVQDSVATFTSREEDFLDSTCTKSHTGPPNSSKVAVKIPHHLKSISNLPGLQKKLQTPPRCTKGCLSFHMPTIVMVTLNQYAKGSEFYLFY